MIELFAGIGSQAKALKNLGINFEHWNVCEFDEHAIRSYNAVHGTDFVTSDVTKITAADLNIVDTDRFTYLLTYSFPCQDLSNAGKGAGMEKGSGTRSGLLWEVERLLNECDELPQVLLMENVPQVHGKKNIEHFNKWIEFLESKGYSNHWKDLNAKDYGIPQSRNRCYMVSILGNYSFDFPTPMPLTLGLKDLLDDIVDERYYLSDRQIDKMKNNTFVSANYSHRVVNENARLDEINQGKLKTKNSTDNQIANTITTNAENMGVCVPYANDTQPFIQIAGDSVIVREASKKGYAVASEGDSINLEYPNSTTRRWRVGKQVAQTLLVSSQQAVCVPYDDAKVINPLKDETPTTVVKTFDIKEMIKENNKNAKHQQDLLQHHEDICRCIPAGTHGSTPHLTKTVVSENPLRIRKLTPKECWRLMGFDDGDVERATETCSNTQLYKQAGNSIVVNVLMAIFKELFITDLNRSDWLDALLRG